MTSTRPENIPAIERATTMNWDEWLRHLSEHDSGESTHAEIARTARRFIPDSLKNPGWWAQGIAIAYAQDRGFRVPGQSSTGTFQVSVSRTIEGDRDEIIEAWENHVGKREHLGRQLSNERRSRTDKRSFWRASLEGAGKIEASTVEKGDGKVMLSLQHRELTDAGDIDLWRPYWKRLLGEFRS